MRIILVIEAEVNTTSLQELKEQVKEHLLELVDVINVELEVP